MASPADGGGNRLLKASITLSYTRLQTLPAAIWANLEPVRKPLITYIYLNVTSQWCKCAGLTAAASGCDRLLKTPIPLSYTRHTARSLMMWLLTLPAALWPKMGPSLILAVFFISYVLIGIDELGVQIEEPFAILPLAPLMMKVRNEVIAVVEELSAEDRQIVII